MARRVLRKESPLGAISFDEYRAISAALAAQYADKAFDRSDMLTLPVITSDALLERVIFIPSSGRWGTLLQLTGDLVAPIISSRIEHLDSADAYFTEMGFALIKSIERAGKGTGLLRHTATAPSFREALLAEAIIRLGTLSKNGEIVTADIPLTSLRWWLGITGRYPYPANIRAVIVQKTDSPLRIDEYALPSSGGAKTMALGCRLPDDPAQPDLLVSPRSDAAIALAKKSGEPLLAAVAILEDAQVLRPDLTQEQALDLFLLA